MAAMPILAVICSKKNNGGKKNRRRKAWTAWEQTTQSGLGQNMSYSDSIRKVAAPRSISTQIF